VHMHEADNFILGGSFLGGLSAQGTMMQ